MTERDSTGTKASSNNYRPKEEAGLGHVRSYDAAIFSFFSFLPFFLSCERNTQVSRSIPVLPFFCLFPWQITVR